MEYSKDLVEWVRAQVARIGRPNAVVGISGGKDSTVVAALLKRALGEEHVIGVYLPCLSGLRDDPDVEWVLANYCGQAHRIDIGTAAGAVATDVTVSAGHWKNGGQADINLLPRLRMTYLYAIAQTCDACVVNTSNRDERAAGWFTLWGDCCGDFSPLGGLHAYEVVAVGRDLGVPEELLVKPPADGLTGRTDEENLGFSYDAVARVLDGEAWDDDEDRKAAARLAAMSWKSGLCRLPLFDRDDPLGLREE